MSDDDAAVPTTGRAALRVALDVVDAFRSRRAEPRAAAVSP